MTNSAEADLEAVIWAAMTKFKVTTAFPLDFLEMVTKAAMDYAAGDSDALTAARREVLFAATAPDPDRPLAAVAGGGTGSRANPPGSDRRVEVPEGATLSTGHSVPAAGNNDVKSGPQPVDKFGPDIHSSKDLSYTQAARALQELR